MNIILVEQRTDGVETPERSYQQSLIRIGRDTAECDVVYDATVYPMVSRRHAELRWFDGKWLLIDLNSSYGTYVDGKRITEPYKVHAGERMQFGKDGPIMKVVWFEVLKDSQPIELKPVPLQKSPPAPALVPNPAAAAQTDSTPFYESIKSTPVPAQSIGSPTPDGKIEFCDDPSRRPFLLSGKEVSLGREPSCDIPFDASATMVSRVHAHIRQVGQNLIVEDNKSFNGTFLNGNRISAPTPLYHNDEICLGVGGPRLRFDSPSRNAPQGASVAGQRSVQAGSAAAAFEAMEESGSKTVFYNLDKPLTSHSAVANKPQIMMSLTFGGKKTLIIGRDKSSDIILDGLQISSRHAKLVDNGSAISVEDLNSTNGIYLNGKRISRSVITPNDSVQIGSFLIKIDASRNVGVFDTRSKTRLDALKISKDAGSRFGSKVRLLDSISLSIQPNEFIGILGPSGSGKSTLIEAMNGMRPATSGNILVNNLDLYTHLDSLKQSIGYVPQDDIIHRDLSVYRTLYYVARLRLSRDISRAEIDQTINEVLDVTGLSERRNVEVSKLSGGQRKRVSIAVELITKPSIIYLDEPTSGLDPGVEERIMKLFRQIAESGRTVILTTHAMENVRLFDKIAVLMRGRLVFFGKPDEALRHLGAESFKGLFDKLEEPITEGVKKHGEKVRQEITEKTAEEWRQRFIQTPIYKKNIDEPLRQLGKQTSGKTAMHSRLGIFGSIRQWMVLSMRYFEVLFKDKLNLLILLAQAPIIAFLTFLVMGRDRPRDLVYFVLALVSIWFGTSVSAREIIREHAIYRRERMVNLGILPYLGSKLFVLGLIVGIQCLLLFVPLKLLDLTDLMPMPGDYGGIPQFWAMLLTSFVGIATGLLISALVKTSELATSFVPLILIPQILFSGIFGVPAGINKAVCMAVPAAWSFDTIKRYSSLDTLEPEGAKINGRTAGQGLYRHVENENDKIIKKAREDIESYQDTTQEKLRKYEDDVRSGFRTSLPQIEDPPAIPAAMKMPKDLSIYITFLHPWMNEIVNQIVLMIMFGVLVITTLIVLRLRDLH